MEEGSQITYLPKSVVYPYYSRTTHWQPINNIQLKIFPATNEHITVGHIVALRDGEPAFNLFDIFRMTYLEYCFEFYLRFLELVA